MKLGGEYRLRDITARKWTKLAEELKIDPEKHIAHVAAQAETLRETLLVIKNEMKDAGLTHPAIDHLAGRLDKRAQEFAAEL